MKEILRTTKFMALEFANGQMAESTRDTGKKGICMGKVLISGEMVANT
jgi:hypothetical protein